MAIGFKVLKNYWFMPFWGDARPLLKRANWDSVNRNEDYMIDYIDEKRRLEKERNEE